MKRRAIRYKNECKIWMDILSKNIFKLLVVFVNKKCSTLFLRNMQIKTVMLYLSIPTSMAVEEKTDTMPSIIEKTERPQPSCAADGE